MLAHCNRDISIREVVIHTNLGLIITASSVKVYLNNKVYECETSEHIILSMSLCHWSAVSLLSKGTPSAANISGQKIP